MAPGAPASTAAPRNDLSNPGAIVTPEAVVLDFQIAGLATRALSFALDFIVSLIALFVVIFLAGLTGAVSGATGIVILLVGLLAILVGYPAGMETLNNGRTLGRMATGTRVVTIEGSPVRFRHAVIRAFLAIVELFATSGGIAVVVALLTKRGQRLGDLTAGTIVIRDRTTKLNAAPQWYAPPVGQEAFVATIDASGVSGERYQVLRDFLGRYPDLDPHARASLAQEMAASLQPHVQSATPPPGLNAADYLVCIAAAATNESVAAFGASPTMAPPPPAAGTGVSAGRDFSAPTAPPPPAAGTGVSSTGGFPPPVAPAPVEPAAPSAPAAPYATPSTVADVPAAPAAPSSPAPSAAPDQPAPPASPGGFSAPS